MHKVVINLEVNSQMEATITEAGVTIHVPNESYRLEAEVCEQIFSAFREARYLAMDYTIDTACGQIQMFTHDYLLQRAARFDSLERLEDTEAFIIRAHSILSDRRFTLACQADWRNMLETLQEEVRSLDPAS